VIRTKGMIGSFIESSAGLGTKTTAPEVNLALANSFEKLIIKNIYFDFY